MTEDDFSTSTDPHIMLTWLLNERRLSQRRLRLYGAACCRLVWHHLHDERSRRAVEVAELFADGLIEARFAEQAGEAAAVVDMIECEATPQEIAWRANEAAVKLLPYPEEAWKLADVWQYVAAVLEADQLLKEGAGLEVLDSWSELSLESGRTVGWTALHPDAMLADLLREMVGNPFRQIQCDVTWRNDAMLTLVGAAYGYRKLPSGHLRSDHLAILADALEAAGCTDAPLLEHLRSDGPHWRGCWGVDAALGLTDR